MALTGILLKTAKGIEEIQTRAHRLPQQKRALLILIDGRLEAQEMVARFPSLGNVQQMLQELVDEGFAEVRGGQAAAIATAAPATRPGPAPQADVSFAEGVRALTRALYDLIGPNADDFGMKMERARDRASFMQAVNASATVAQSFAGKKKADAFREKAAALAEQIYKADDRAS